MRSAFDGYPLIQAFRVFYDEWRKDGEASGLMGLTQTEMWVGSTSHLNIYEEHPDVSASEVHLPRTTLSHYCGAHGSSNSSTRAMRRAMQTT